MSNISKVHKLEEALKVAQQAEKQVEIDARLASMGYVGRYFATHHLNRYMTSKPSFHFNLMHYIEAKYEAGRYDEYFYDVEIVEVHKDGERLHLKIEPSRVSWSASIYHHEISQEQYETAKIIMSANLVTSVDTVRFAFKAQDMISNGNATEESSAAAHLESLGIGYIDLLDNPRVLENLRWQRYPYLFGTELRKLPQWLELIESITNAIETHAREWGIHIMNRDLPRVKILRTFVREQKQKRLI